MLCVCEIVFLKGVENDRNYEVLSKIFWTVATIYTAVVVAWSTGPKRPNCEFFVLLRHFAATA
jgi:hypothetical protein